MKPDRIDSGSGGALPDVRLHVLGTPVDVVTMDVAVQCAARFLTSEGCHSILANNPEKVMAARGNPALLRALEHASLVVPDGIGIVIAARMLHGAVMDRVAGAELMPNLCALAADRNRSIFLFGATEDVNRKAAELLEHRYPGLIVAGRRHGYINDADMPDLIKTINDSGADILFVGLGSPRQELWIERHRESLNVRICQGVGGTFDVLAGRVKRAPQFFLKSNLEWLYRLLADPRRFSRQKALPHFAALVMKNKFVGIAAKNTGRGSVAG